MVFTLVIFFLLSQWSLPTGHALACAQCISRGAVSVRYGFSVDLCYCAFLSIITARSTDICRWRWSLHQKKSRKAQENICFTGRLFSGEISSRDFVQAVLLDSASIISAIVGGSAFLLPASAQCLRARTTGKKQAILWGYCLNFCHKRRQKNPILGQILNDISKCCFVAIWRGYASWACRTSRSRHRGLPWVQKTVREQPNRSSKYNMHKCIHDVGDLFPLATPCALYVLRRQRQKPTF